LVSTLEASASVGALVLCSAICKQPRFLPQRYDPSWPSFDCFLKSSSRNPVIAGKGDKLLDMTFCVVPKLAGSRSQIPRTASPCRAGCRSDTIPVTIPMARSTCISRTRAPAPKGKRTGCRPEGTLQFDDALLCAEVGSAHGKWNPPPVTGVPGGTRCGTVGRLIGKRGSDRCHHGIERARKRRKRFVDGDAGLDRRFRLGGVLGEEIGTERCGGAL
jgi:hypothetical protein